MQFRVVRSILSMTISALGVLSVASCGPDTPATSAGDSLASSPVDPPRNAPAAPQQPRSLTGPGPAPHVDESPLSPPKDAQWTLLVYSSRGPSHVSDANGLKKMLIAKTARRDWYVIHSGDESDIYFGYYRSFDNQVDPSSKAAQADLQMVKNIELLDTDGQPELAFKRAGFVPIAAPDPVAPPEWSLFNKDRDKNPKDPTRAYWSLQIMAFKSNPLRKEAALQAVSALRKDGVDAYYFHGDTVSSVCVGAWPMSAAEQESNHMVNQDKTPVVYPEQLANVMKNLPKRYDTQGHELPPVDDQGHELVPVAPKLNITDNSLKECMKKFPFHSVNYLARVKEGTDEKVFRDPSFLVVVPRAPGNGYFDSDEVTPADFASGQDSASPNPLFRQNVPAGQLPGAPAHTKGPIGAEPPAPQPGVGHLRHLGEN
jgi:hypothetical protein